MPSAAAPALVSSVVSDSVGPYGLQPIRLLCSEDSPGKNIGAGCHALLQGMFPTRDPTQVSCIAGRFFTTEPPEKPSFLLNKQAKPLSPTIPGHKVLNGEDLLDKPEVPM